MGSFFCTDLHLDRKGSLQRELSQTEIALINFITKTIAVWLVSFPVETLIE